MTIEEFNQRIDELATTIAQITDVLFPPEKGGSGSGCHGDNCGRPAADGSHSGDHNNAKPTREGPGQNRPRSGVRPSAVNPNRREIVYTEEPSSDGRPRSGVRPSALKPKKTAEVFDKDTLKAIDEFMEQYSGLMKDLAEIEAEEKKSG